MSPLPGAYRSLQAEPNSDGQHWAWHLGRASTSCKSRKTPLDSAQTWYGRPIVQLSNASQPEHYRPHLNFENLEYLTPWKLLLHRKTRSVDSDQSSPVIEQSYPSTSPLVALP